MLKRIASNVITRVVVALILAVLFAWVGTGRAHAQAPANTCSNTSYQCDQGQAYSVCLALITWYAAQMNFLSPRCEAAAQNWNGKANQQPVNGGGVVGFGQTVWIAAKTCAARPAEPTWGIPAGHQGTVCSSGCEYALDVPGPGLSATGQVCDSTTEPVVDTDGDGEPDETDAFPNDPAESVDTDGDGIGDNADFSPEDPTDGEDTPGEEDGDDEGDNTASGGGTCAAPPTCSGDGIQCAQLWQLWKTRCEGTANGSVTGDPQNCASAIIVTSPDPVANAQLLTLRKIACDSDGGTGNASGDANGNGVADVLEGEGTDPPVDEDDDVTRFGLGINTDMLDTENIFGGGQCPTVPSFPIMGTTISSSDFPYFCDFMAAARIIIPLLAAFQALSILMGRNS